MQQVGLARSELGNQEDLYHFEPMPLGENGQPGLRGWRLLRASLPVSSEAMSTP
jgi:hypothetical protein